MGCKAVVFSIYICNSKKLKAVYYVDEYKRQFATL